MDVVGEDRITSTDSTYESSSGSAAEVIAVASRGLQFNPLDLAAVAKKTPGFVGADLMSLAKEAAMLAVERLSLAQGLLAPIALLGDGEDYVVPHVDAAAAAAATVAPASSSNSDELGSSSDSPSNLAGHVSAEEDHQTSTASASTSSSYGSQLQRRNGSNSSGPLPPGALADLFVTEADFMAATKLVQPTAKREGFAMAPDVSWDDIGALAGVRDELSLSVRVGLTGFDLMYIYAR